MSPLVLAVDGGNSKTDVALLDGDGTLVLGGGLFADPEGRFLTAVRTAAPGLEEEFSVVAADAPPMAGAALLGLGHVGAVVPAGVVAGAFRAARPPAVDDGP